MIKAILIVLTGVFALIAQGVYFILDDRTPNTDPKDKPYKKYWHAAGGLIHAWMYYVMADNYGLPWGLIMACMTWSLFDGFINWILNRGFFYVGTTAIIDKVQQWLAKLLHIDVELLSAILKLLLVLTALYFTIHYYGKF